MKGRGKHPWMDDAACATGQHDTRWWDEDHPALWNEGRAVCAVICPVRADCLTYGTSRRLSGVYGGIPLKQGQPLT